MSRPKLMAYECPVCGKKMTRSSDSSFTCSAGHLRFQHELTGSPWLDSDGVWHDLDFGGAA